MYIYHRENPNLFTSEVTLMKNMGEFTPSIHKKQAQFAYFMGHSVLNTIGFDIVHNEKGYVYLNKCRGQYSRGYFCESAMGTTKLTFNIYQTG